MDNFPQIKRQDIPRPLWEYFMYVSRCIKCKRWTLPDYSDVTRVRFIPTIPKLNLEELYDERGIAFQLIYCTNEINCTARLRLLLNPVN